MESQVAAMARSASAGVPATAAWESFRHDMVVHALVISKLGYCNMLYVALFLKTVQKLQIAQNAVVRVVTRVGWFDSVGPLLE